MGETGEVNEIVQTKGSKSANGVEEMIFVGKTKKKWLEVATFINLWKEQNPHYNINGANCQKFGRDFVVFLCGEDALNMLPANDHCQMIVPFVSIAATGIGAVIGGPLLAIVKGFASWIIGTAVFRHRQASLGYYAWPQGPSTLATVEC